MAVRNKKINKKIMLKGVVTDSPAILMSKPFAQRRRFFFNSHYELVFLLSLRSYRRRQLFFSLIVDTECAD